MRGLEVLGTVKPDMLRQIESMIRNKDYGIEEVKFDDSLLKHAELLDDTLMRVRSFRVDITCEEDLRLLTGSFERTKAHGDNLIRLRVVQVDNYNYKRRFRPTATVERKRLL